MLLIKKQILLNEPLRAVRDTKDRFVQIDGKWYVERNCGEVVLDGSSDELWSKGGYKTSFYLADLYNRISLATVSNDNKNGICDRFCVKKNNDIAEDDYLSMAINHDSNGSLFILFPSGTTSIDSVKSYLSNNPATLIYPKKTTYEPVEISPVLNTYTDVTHITNNSTIPMNMPIVNSGYEIIAKPSTKYTVVGMTNGRIGDSTIVNGTITTPATLDDPFLRPYGTGTTSKVMLLEGEPANIPSYFKGIKSVFEDKVTEDGKYACEVRVYNDLGNETVQTLYLDEPLYNTNNITIYNDKLGYWKNYDMRDYQDGDFGTYLTDMTKTVYQLAEPVFVPLIDNCPNWVIGSWDNCSIHFDSIIPLLATRYRYTGNVPSVISLNEEVSTVSDISDQQDALLVDMATELAVIKLTM